jgi:hypothetical protein
MTKKQIDQISLAEALKVVKNINFNTSDSQIKAQARKILRNLKKIK